MKVGNAIQGGLAGVTTLGLISESLKSLNGNAPLNSFNGNKLKKKFKKTASKKGSTKQYIELAGELLNSSASLGLSALGKKKNTVIKGGILGTAAGLGNVFLNNDHKGKNKFNGKAQPSDDESLTTKLLKVSLHTIGGLVAGTIGEKVRKTKRKRKRK